VVDQIDLIVGGLDVTVERAMKVVTLEATAILIEETPRDTGWARANWVPQIGQPFANTAGTRELAERGTLDLSVQQGGVAEVATQYRVERGRVFITNNVPYILLLNEGSSTQAPAGYVQIGLAKAVRNAERKLRPAD